MLNNILPSILVSKTILDHFSSALTPTDSLLLFPNLLILNSSALFFWVFLIPQIGLLYYFTETELVWAYFYVTIRFVHFSFLHFYFSLGSFSYFFLKFCILFYFIIWLHWVLVAACGIFCGTLPSL